MGKPGSVLLVTLFLATATLVAQTSQPATPQGAKAPAGKMTMDCQQMAQDHQKMMDDMKAMDARLDTLVQQMNSATGPAKVDATAAVVNEMVTQRKSMRESMAGMQGKMMVHMMEHMHAGGADALMKCPVMQHMK